MRSLANAILSEWEELQSNITPSHNDETPGIVQPSTKRRREAGTGAEESQNKKFHMSPKRQLGANERCGQRSLDVDGMSTSIRQYVLCEDTQARNGQEANVNESSNSQMGNSRFLRRSHTQISLGDSHVNPRVYLPQPGTQRRNSVGDRRRYSSQPMYAPNLNNFTPTLHVSQGNPVGSSSPQASGSRYPFLNIIPQQMAYNGWDRRYVVTPEQAAPPGNEQFPPSRCARTLSRGATSPPNTTPNWPPRDPWNQNNFQSINHHAASMFAFAGPTTYTIWQVPQSQSPNYLWSKLEIGENRLRNANVEDPFMQADFNQFGNMQQLASVPQSPTSILVAEETGIPLQDINYLAEQAGFVEVGNLYEPVPTMPCDLSNMKGTREIHTYNHGMDVSLWQAELHSCENWLAPISAIHEDSSGTLGIEGYQMYLPDQNIIPMQPAFASNRNWPGPLSTVPGEPSCTLEMEEFQDIFYPDLATPQIQGTYLASEGLQEQEQERTEPQNLSTLPGMENSQAFKGSGALSRGLDSYADELWKTAIAAELGEYEEFLTSDPVELIILGGSPESEAPGSPSEVVGMGHH
jgi:hypothetical protein